MIIWIQRHVRFERCKSTFLCSIRPFVLLLLILFKCISGRGVPLKFLCSFVFAVFIGTHSRKYLYSKSVVFLDRLINVNMFSMSCMVISVRAQPSSMIVFEEMSSVLVVYARLHIPRLLCTGTRKRSDGKTKGALAPEVSPKADVHCFENVGVLLCIYAEECVSEHTLFHLNYFLKSIFNLMQAEPIILIILIIFTNNTV